MLFGFTGDPVEDFEIAKRLVGSYPAVDLAGLAATTADRAAPHSARVAAAWALGFVDEAGSSAATLRRITDDTDEPDDLRDHAAEALASMRYEP